MARLARAVIPGVAHHVTQRGDRRERVYRDFQDFLDRAEVAVTAIRGSRSTGRPVGSPALDRSIGGPHDAGSGRAKAGPQAASTRGRRSG